MTASNLVDLDQAARTIGVDRRALDSFIGGGGRVSVSWVDRPGSGVAMGTGSMPMTSDGFPDFEAVVAAGGSVRGVIPPDGSPMVQNVNGSGNVVEYAAIVDLGDGSAPFLVKGSDALAAAGSSADDRTQLVSTLQSVLAELPRNLEQARAWSIANNWPVWEKDATASKTRLDASA